MPSLEPKTPIFPISRPERQPQRNHAKTNGAPPSGDAPLMLYPLVCTQFLTQNRDTFLRGLPLGVRLSWRRPAAAAPAEDGQDTAGRGPRNRSDRSRAAGKPPRMTASAMIWRAKGNSRRGPSMLTKGCRCWAGTFCTLTRPPYDSSTLTITSSPIGGLGLKMQIDLIVALAALARVNVDAD